MVKWVLWKDYCSSHCSDWLRISRQKRNPNLQSFSVQNHVCVLSTSTWMGKKWPSEPQLRKTMGCLNLYRNLLTMWKMVLSGFPRQSTVRRLECPSANLHASAPLAPRLGMSACAVAPLQLAEQPLPAPVPWQGPPACVSVQSPGNGALHPCPSSAQL